MDRKKTTQFLRELLLHNRLNVRGSYYASEVSIDYGSINVRRVDFMQFTPAGGLDVSDIEKGIFTCYEVKSCTADAYSGNGLNFLGEKNYIVTTMECYKKLIEDFNSGKFDKHLKECFPEASHHYGVIVAVPKDRDMYDEFQQPTEIDYDISNWETKIIVNCNQGRRKRSMNELLFCMLRSGE